MFTRGSVQLAVEWMVDVEMPNRPERPFPADKLVSPAGQPFKDIDDITERRAKDRELKDLLQRKEVLLQELKHRVANSLQIIASILLLKARTVRSEETRLHLQDAHQRVMSVAAVQQQLQASEPG